jgi:adenylate cyclase
VRFGETSAMAEVEGMMLSLQTDRAGGFGEAEVDLFRRVVPIFGLAYKAIIGVHTSRVLLETYLGADPARRVLQGAIERGKAETIQAVLWFSDLQGFTRIADTAPKDQILELLNDYAD